MIKTNSKRSFWESQFQAWHESGLSVIRWCNENNINPSTFYYWKNIVEPTKKTPSTKDNQWVEVIVNNEIVKEEQVETLLLKYHDYTLHIPTKVDETNLTKVLAALRSLC